MDGHYLHAGHLPRDLRKDFVLFQAHQISSREITSQLVAVFVQKPARLTFPATKPVNSLE
jgi:hypothetical protein